MLHKKSGAYIALFIMATLIIQLNFVRQAKASDHIDGPQLANDHAY